MTNFAVFLQQKHISTTSLKHLKYHLSAPVQILLETSANTTLSACVRFGRAHCTQNPCAAAAPRVRPWACADQAEHRWHG